jgi:peptidoglycan-associated lipoprotein
MNTKQMAKIMVVMALCLMLVAAGGCKHGKKGVVEPKLTETPPATSGQNPLPTGIDHINWQARSDLAKIYFDYNKFSLRADAIKTLNANAEIMKKDASNVMFQIEGHCDERGTQEYNLALGEKRALACRDYLIKVGIPGDRIVTISYGKERPEKEGRDESAWKFNRRCQFDSGTK